MVREAEENADSDKERRDLIEARNQAESLIHSTENRWKNMLTKLIRQRLRR
jgi:molecular chaperone DnaK